MIELESSDGERVLGCVIIENLLCIQTSHSRENPSCSARNKHCLRKHLQILLSAFLLDRFYGVDVETNFGNLYLWPPLKAQIKIGPKSMKNGVLLILVMCKSSHLSLRIIHTPI